ncbi:MAG: inositol monophosphatase family protein [Verrucomicrobiae bacterium]|nr:inositol monophosphatase family protein [Verrucomicrobiae bacterium]
MFLDVAIDAARQAGKLLKDNFGTELVVNETHAHDIKLALDVQAQELIEGIILKAYPDHAIFGEEGIRGNQESPHRWIIDPLDGTVNFSYGLPHFAVSIGMEKMGEMVVGVIYDPMRDELFTAQKGGPAQLNGRDIRVSNRATVGEAILSLGMSKHADSIEAGLNQIRHYAVRARKLRSMGSAALDMAFIACGRLDAYMERSISLWDIAAGKVILECAGGTVELSDNKTGKNLEIIASNGKLDLRFME